MLLVCFILSFLFHKLFQGRASLHELMIFPKKICPGHTFGTFKCGLWLTLPSRLNASLRFVSVYYIGTPTRNLSLFCKFLLFLFSSVFATLFASYKTKLKYFSQTYVVKVIYPPSRLIESAILFYVSIVFKNVTLAIIKVELFIE